MNFSGSEQISRNFTVLVTPLPWGIGHTTRLFPILTLLNNRNFTVLVAGDENCKSLVNKSFPEIQVLSAPEYKIRYPERGRYMAVKILSQLPKIYRVILKEKKWLKKVVAKYQPDLIISDNRPGMYHPAIPSIYITHQIQIKARFQLTEWLLHNIHSRIIHKFNQCWIPDFPDDERSLAGVLSRTGRNNPHFVYTGPLSRFNTPPVQVQKPEFDLLILLSGPEPQRSMLEEKLRNAAAGESLKTLLVRGLPSADQTAAVDHGTVTILNHLETEILSRYLVETPVVICRSGYSTIMDLIQLHKSAILIPTPGQTEQEYLANYLSRKHWFLAFHQENFSLHQALEQFKTFQPNPMPVPDPDLLKQAIEPILQQVVTFKLKTS